MSCVYVLSNPAMPGLLKIGFTDGSAADRARELSAATGVPAPFFVEFSKEDPLAEFLEPAVHAAIAGSRVNPMREFFRLAPTEAASAIERIANEPDFWLSAIMRVWNRAAPQWRERFLETVDRPVFDGTRTA